jgi:hypothetical protein
MGIHTGTPIVAGDHYLGMVVHVAARLCAAAYGGQVLVSGATATLLEDELPSGTALRDLGEHALKDIPRPAHVFQLLLPQLPAGSAALRTTCEPPTNIPAPETALIGRDAELSAVVAALRQGHARLVTLTGPGGSGKTQLALQAARQLRAEFAGGAFFVDLVPVSDARRILAAAAEALGLSEAAGRTLEDVLFDWLRGRPALLVLDNLEHLAEAGAPVASLLARSGASGASRSCDRPGSGRHVHARGLPHCPSARRGLRPHRALVPPRTCRRRR